jgi:hypothetical protein
MRLAENRVAVTGEVYATRLRSSGITRGETALTSGSECFLKGRSPPLSLITSSLVDLGCGQPLIAELAHPHLVDRLVGVSPFGTRPADACPDGVF